MSIFFAGGWATSPSQFPWFKEHAKFVVPFCDLIPSEFKKELEKFIEDEVEPVSLVGWSTGAHILLKHCTSLFPCFRKVILVSPFLSFTDSFPARVINSMIDEFDLNSESVIRQFHLNCGETGQFQNYECEAEKLRCGLEFLGESKISEFDVWGENLILVRGSRDRIVRKKAFKKLVDSLPEVEILFPDFGHKPDESFLVSLLKERL